MRSRVFLVTTALLVASPANAATYLTTFTGTVYNATDGAGAFGPPGTSLEGMAFSAVFELTSPLAGAYTVTSPTFSFIGGGTAYGPGVPSPVSGMLTINGTTLAVPGSSMGYGRISDVLTNDELHYYAEGSSNGLITYLQTSIFSSNNFLSAADLTAPISYSLNSLDGNSGQFGIYDPNNASIPRSFGFLQISSVTISPLASAVPEPAAWATMLLGFGLIGGAMRRRQKTRLNFRHASQSPVYNPTP